MLMKMPMFKVIRNFAQNVKQRIPSIKFRYGQRKSQKGIFLKIHTYFAASVYIIAFLNDR